MKIIFLDIDGVLNCEQEYINGSCEYVEDALSIGIRTSIIPIIGKDKITKDIVDFYLKAKDV